MFVVPAQTQRFATRREFCRNRRCPMRRYARRKGQGCSPGPDLYVAPASKKSLRDCPQCKWAKRLPPRLTRWRRRAAPLHRGQRLACSSRPVNFRFFGKRSAQLNERNACVAKLRAAMHTLDHQLDFVHRFRVIPNANQIRFLEHLVGNGFSERLLVIQCNLESSYAVVLLPYLIVAVIPIPRPNQDAIQRQWTFNSQRDAFADSVAVGAFAPGT